MKRLLILISLTAAMAMPAATTEPYTKAKITMTNLANFVNGSSIDINGTDVRRATNGAPADISTWVHITNSIVNQVTNWMRHFNEYSPSGTEGVWTNDCTPTNFFLVGMPSQALVVTLSTGSGNWGFVTYETNQWTNTFPWYLPFTTELLTTRTGIVSDAVAGLNTYPSNSFGTGTVVMAKFTDLTTPQTVGNKLMTNMVGSNSTYHGTVGRLSGGDISATTLSNLTAKLITLSHTSRLAVVQMLESDRLQIAGATRTNWLVVDESGVWLLLTDTSVSYTNAAPLNGEIVNWGTMLTLLPLRSAGQTNYWGSRQVFTNIAANIEFVHGFTGSIAQLFAPMLYYPTNWGPLSSTGTNFTTGTALAGALLFGSGAKIGGPDGSSSGNAAIGVNATVWIDDFPPAWAVGPNTLVTNFGRFAMGLNSEKATNAGAYSFFGTATEDNEFRIADPAVQSFVRFGPPIKNLNTVAESTNVHRGDISFPQKVVSTIADGHNIVDLGTNVSVRVANSSATATWRLGGFRGGNRDGKLAIVDFVTGFPFTVEQESGDTTTLTERLSTGYGTNFTTAGNCRTWWLYNNTTLRWDLQGMHPPIAASTNSLATTDGNATNLSVWPQTSNSVALKVNQRHNQSNDLIQVVNSNGLPMFKVDAYGSVIQSNAAPISIALWNTNRNLTNTVAPSALWSVPSYDSTNIAFGDDGFFGLMARKRIGKLVASGSTTFQILGDISTSVGTASAAAPDADNPAMINLVTTAATTGTDLGWSGNNTLVNHFNRTLRAHVWVKMQETNQVRYWFGFTTATATTMAGADDPAGDYAAFRYSSQAPEITWKCITKDNTTQGATDSTVGPTTDDVMLSLVWTPGASVRFYINGTLVGTRTTNLPRSSVACRLIAYGETTENVNKNLRIAHCVWEETR